MGSWLRSLGLGQYEAAFRDNAVDAEVLFELNDNDLTQLGVLLGHRKRLLKAIAELASADKIAPPTSPAQATTAERRPITVIFCDLVGSTSIAAKLDAEDWRNLVNAYLDQASTAVTDFGGHVLKKLGDGLMALFGYPQAQENDAERAVRAALAIQRALADLNAGNARSGAPELSARIGLECGSVVVDAAGEVFGEAPNVAARVQAAAEPGSILITAAVQRQTAGLFVAEDRGAHELKGVMEPVTLYRIVRASGGGRRGGARALTSFVGREEYIGTLLRRWDRVRAGEGQFVLIVGEPGLGKSRLIEEFHTRLGETPHTWTECSSSQLLQNTPLHPLAEWGRLRFGEDLPAEQRLADLENTLRLVGLDVGEYAPLIAPLVDIPLPKERAAKFAPEELRRRQLAAVTAWFLAGARTQPVVLAFEDLHWADPTSLDLIQSLAERGAQAPLLVVATTRPEFRAPWGMRSHHAVVALAPLDRTEVRRMVGDIAAQHALPQEVVERVSERTGGVPLFVEEVTRLLVERGEQGGVQAIPPTLQQSLAARLDRLGPAREVAQVGAVLGRDFVYALLRDVAGLDESALQAALERLTEADLLFVEGAPPEAKYRFKHALIQDAAYDSLLKSRRQGLHARAAEILRESASPEPEAIAHHFTQAGLDDLAIQWWGKAGDQALRRSAFQEAIAHLGKAIEMADRAAGGTVAGPAARQGAAGGVAPGQRVKLQTDYGRALMWSKGFDAEETKVAFARLSEFEASAESAAARFVALDAQCLRYFTRGEYTEARELAETFLREAEAEGRSMEAGAARRMLGLVLLHQGNLHAARSILEQALADYLPERDAATQSRFGRDTEVSAAAYLALAYWHVGEVDRARQSIERALRRADELGSVAARANALYWQTVLEAHRGDASATHDVADALHRLTEEYGIRTYADFCQIFASWAYGRLTDPEAGAERLKQAIATLNAAQGGKTGTRLYHGLLAELELVMSRPDCALEQIDEALEIADLKGGHYREPYLHHLRGDILLKRDPANPALAKDAYQTAIAVAKQQGARSYELLSALSLAKLYQSTGRPADANAVLSPALEGFAPTPEMPEIAEAQSLLAALTETDPVKAAIAQRQRRLDLQTSYALAVSFSKGSAADETKAAFERAGDLATRAEFPAERFSALLGQAYWSLQRGEVRAARDIAQRLLREAEADGRSSAFGEAHRVRGLAFLFLGDLAKARSEFELALNSFDMQSDGEARENFLWDAGAACRASLAQASWYSGDLHLARQLITEAISSGRELAPPPSTAYVLSVKIYIEGHRNDLESVVADAENLLKVGQQHSMDFYLAISRIYLSWARGGLGDVRSGADELRSSLNTYATQGNRLGTPYFLGCLAEPRGRGGGT